MSDANRRQPAVISLPPPVLKGPVSIEEALQNRRSVRTYRSDPVTIEQVSQVLWAVQGITSSSGYRTAPSAGPCYPLETDIAAVRVASVDPGVYRYQPQEHQLQLRFTGDILGDLAAATLGQTFLSQAPLAVIFSARPDRTTRRYGERGNRYVYMDVGHAGQNLHLQVVSLGLGTVVIGAFKDDAVARVLRLPEVEHPLYIMPVGHMP